MVCSNTRLLPSVFAAIWAPINYFLVNLSTVPLGLLKFALGEFTFAANSDALNFNMDLFRDPINSILSSM